jgi:hypothetical protein
MTKPLRHTTILFAALLAAAAAAFAAPVAGGAPAAPQRDKSHCWLDVINDWLDNNQVDNVYAVPCYTQAIQQLSARPDIAGYSSAIDDIHRALLAVIRQDRNDGGQSGGGSQQGPDSSSSQSPGGGGPNSSGGGGGGHHSFFGIGGPSSATSVPLPLIILGALAVLLALAALATWFARRFQARRPAPAPAVPRRR